MQGGGSFNGCRKLERAEEGGGAKWIGRRTGKADASGARKRALPLHPEMESCFESEVDFACGSQRKRATAEKPGLMACATRRAIRSGERGRKERGLIVSSTAELKVAQELLRSYTSTQHTFAFQWGWRGGGPGRVGTQMETPEMQYNKEFEGYSAIIGGTGLRPGTYISAKKP